MSKFLLALRDDPSAFENLSPEDMQAALGRYQEWGERYQDRLVVGYKLADGDGKTATRSGGDLSATDGPFGEAKEVLGGFYVLRAENYEDAMRVVADHPHLDFGSIEVREIDLMGGPDPYES